MKLTLISFAMGGNKHICVYLGPKKILETVPSISSGVGEMTRKVPKDVAHISAGMLALSVAVFTGRHQLSGIRLRSCAPELRRQDRPCKIEIHH